MTRFYLPGLGPRGRAAVDEAEKRRLSLEGKGPLLRRMKEKAQAKKLAAPAVSKPKPAPQVDHAAHLEASLAKSFQRQALAAANAGAAAMAGPITNDDRKNAWAKALGGKRPAPSTSAASVPDDPRRAAWKRAMQRPSAGVEGATEDGGKTVDRAAAWKRAMKSPRD